MDSLNNNTTNNSHVAEDCKLENALKRGREKAKEVAEKDSFDRARMKVKIILACTVWSSVHDLPLGLLTHDSFHQLLKDVKPLF